MILGDLDIWEQAFKEMNLSENVQFVSRGRLITEASQVEMFNKIQALLNSNGMECSHKWLYSLDPSELNEAEATKVNNLYKLGIERGFIEDPDAEEQAAEGSDTECPVAQEAPAVQAPIAPASVPALAPTSAFTVLYSAMRGGEIKSGESYSNAVSPRAAKADIISQLERAGYSNIKILAIECGDPDDCGKDCSNTYCMQAANTQIASQDDQIPDYDEDTIPFESDKEEEKAVEEADGKEEADAEKADGKADDTEADSAKSDDKESDEEADKADDKADDKEEADKKEEDAEEPDEKLKDDSDAKAEKASDKEKEDKELDASEKTALKDSYKKAFKAAMQKCKFFDKAFDDLTLEEKIEFFTALSAAWGSKADPSEFMSDKEVQQLQTIVVKK